MNVWTLLYFTTFIFYVYSGAYVLRLNHKSIVNVLFFTMCVSLSAWALGYAISIGASDIQQAQAWRGVSTFGWTFFYSNLLLFNAAITKSRISPKESKLIYLAYLPSLVFFLRFLNHDTGNFVQSAYGWVYLLYYKGIWSYGFDIFYLICVVSSFALLLQWKRKTESLRERKQVQIIITSLIGAFVGGGLTDTLLPIFGIKILPLGIIFCSIAILGMWVAITKYKMMNLTQEIAAEHVLVTMRDPVIVLNPQYLIGQVNAAALEVAGYQQTELVGEHVQKLLPDFNGSNIIFNELLRKGHTNEHEITMRNSSGRDVPCLCSGVYVTSDFGEKIGLILVLHDITNRKERERLVYRINEDLKTKIIKINNVFSNVQEGILTFSDDLIIHNEYSIECQRLFNGPIENQPFYEAILPEDLEAQKFTKSLLNRIFESDEHMRTLYMPLLPDRAMLHGLNVTIQYKFTVDETRKPMMMAIIADRTEKVNLENQRDTERKKLRMVVKAIVHRDDFLDLVEDFRNFASDEISLVSTDIKQFLRRLHTYKGNFSQFDMMSLVDQIHYLEECLTTQSNKKCFLVREEELLKWLQDDLDIIEEIVGRGYFEGSNRISVEAVQLDHLKSLAAKNVDSSVAKELIAQINGLYNKTFHELLGNYPEYTVRLGERWGKKIEPFTISGDQVYVNPSDYQVLVKGISHIFRNAVAHGIETEDERTDKGKMPLGHVTCHIKELEESVVISISDDGSGINPLEVASVAIKSGIITLDVLSEMEDTELLQLIFAEHITTVNQATVVSGRGIGLTAVKQAVEQMGGRISVKSEWGKGTIFEIFLPKK